MLNQRVSSGALIALLGATFAVSSCTLSPEPLDIATKEEIVLNDLSTVSKAQTPISGPLTLYETLARVVAYNLDHRTRQMEEALASRQADLANFDMLPIAMADATHSSRSNKAASTEAGYYTDEASESPSYSQDQVRQTADLKLSWNILDFGVSYFQAQQQANRALIGDANRQKLMLRLLQQARTTYWRAVAAQRLQPEVLATLTDARKSLGEIEQAYNERLRPPLPTLQSQRALLEVVSQLEALDRQLGAAVLELKALINLPPTTEITLVMPDELLVPPEAKLPMDELELIALLNSSDISEQIYNLRIEQAEGRKALLRLAPGLELSGELSYDSNSFLVNNVWHEAAGRVSWNLMRLLSLPSTLAMADARSDLAEIRRLALTMAVISRVNIARWRYADMVTQFSRAKQLHAIEDKIAALSSAAESAMALDSVERVRSQAAALRSKLRYYETYSNLQDALGAMYVSLGLNPLPQGYHIPLSQIHETLETQFGAWEGGQLPRLETMRQAAKTEE